MPAILKSINFAITVMFLLALTGLGKKTYSSPTPLPTTDLLRQVIVAHYRAIEDNRLEEAMHYYHSQARQHHFLNRYNVVYPENRLVPVRFF